MSIAYGKYELTIHNFNDIILFIYYYYVTKEKVIIMKISVKVRLRAICTIYNIDFLVGKGEYEI